MGEGGILAYLNDFAPIYMTEFLLGEVTPTIKNRLTTKVEELHPDLGPVLPENVTYVFLSFLSIVSVMYTPFRLPSSLPIGPL